MTFAQSLCWLSVDSPLISVEAVVVEEAAAAAWRGTAASVSVRKDAVSTKVLMRFVGNSPFSGLAPKRWLLVRW
jgi:hypothetical protein